MEMGPSSVMMKEMEVKDISLHAQSVLMNKYSFPRRFLAEKDNANYVFALLLKIRRLNMFYSNCFIKLSFNIFREQLQGFMRVSCYLCVTS